MKEIFSQDHRDFKDRQLLLNVPVDADNEVAKAQVYRFQQWLHCLRHLGEITESNLGHDPITIWESEGGR